MKSSGVKWCEMQWNVVKWNGVIWTAVKCGEVKSEVIWSAVKWSEVEWIGVMWSGVKWCEVEWSEVKIFREMCVLSSMYSKTCQVDHLHKVTTCWCWPHIGRTSKVLCSLHIRPPPELFHLYMLDTCLCFPREMEPGYCLYLPILTMVVLQASHISKSLCLV